MGDLDKVVGVFVSGMSQEGKIVTLECPIEWEVPKRLTMDDVEWTLLSATCPDITSSRYILVYQRTN